MYRNDQAIREILSNILLPAIANNDTITTLILVAFQRVHPF